MEPFTVVGLGALAVALPPAVLLALECALAALPPPRAPWKQARRPRLAVLVPAHDEEALLPRALRSVRDQLAPGDRLLVVAHNCRDATAARARALGAEVIEPRDSGSRGKSDAVLAGLEYLRGDARPEENAPRRPEYAEGRGGETSRGGPPDRGVSAGRESGSSRGSSPRGSASSGLRGAFVSARPEVVVILDADGVLRRGSLDALARAASFHGSAVQAEYVFRAPRGGGGRAVVSRFSILLKNVVRSRGSHRLGLGCLVTGSGCAFPLEALHGVPQGDGAIAEDTQLALDLARRGTPCRFVPEARVTSELPLLRAHATRQHRRWEHGHLELCLRSPALVLEALARRNGRLLALAIEVAVPPIGVLCAALFLASACLAASPASGPARAGLALALGALGSLIAVLSATAVRELGLRGAVQVARGLAAYAIWKLPVLADYAADRERSWTRTPRERDARRPSASITAAASTGGSQET